MLRYFKIYRALWRVSLAADMAHRSNFIWRMIFGLIYLFLGQGVFIFVFSQLSTFGGWSLGDILIFTGTTYLIDLIWMTMFFFNVLMLPDRINTGQVDLILTKPVNAQFLLSTYNLNLDNFLPSLIGVATVVYGVILNKNEVTATSILLYCALVINGVLLLHFTYLMAHCVAFWQPRFRFAVDIVDWLHQFGMRPDVIYTGGVRFVMAYLLPALMFVNIPSRVLMGDVNTAEILGGLGISIAVICLSQWVWHLSLSHYTSASS